MICAHTYAYPSLDSKTGWYCPNCSTAVAQPLSSRLSEKAGQRFKPTTAQNHPERCPAQTPRKLDNAPPWQTVTTRMSRNTYYYRYRAGVGHIITHDRHIPGGNIKNPIAQARAMEVNRWIARGEPPDRILALIDRWRYNRTTSGA